MKKSVKRGIANFFDENYSIWIDNSRISIRREYLALLNGVKGKNVLDMGCGLGYDAWLLSQKGAAGLGIDISRKSIEYCISRNLKSWTFMTGDSETIRLTQSFDVVLSSMELMYHGVIWKTFNNYTKYLREGGLYLLVINNPYLTSLDYGFEYRRETVYARKFIRANTLIEKHHHPLSMIINSACRYGLKLLNLREISCKDDDCRDFSQENKFGFPEFIALLFRKD